MRPACFIAILIFTGCEEGEGDRCEPSEVRCAGSSEALVCHDGALVRLRCGGAGGCSTTDETTRCDQGHAREGETCVGGVACSGGGSEASTSLLECQEGRFVRVADCPSGCELGGGRAVCPHPELVPPLESP